MTAGRGISAFRLAQRSLWHHRGQTLLIILLSVMISATTVFAAGYQRQVQQAVADSTFAPDGPGSAWQLLGASDTSPLSVLPADTDRLFEEPVAGRVVPVIWLTPTFPNGIAGPMTWRADSCQHLIMDSGRCPEVINEVAVSVPDAERYGVRAGQVLQRLSPISEPQAITVTGIYRPRDPAEGYWFGNPPVGRSGFNTADAPQSNPLITVSDFGDTLGVQDTLDLRLDRAAIGIDDLAELRAATSQLAKAAVADKIRLNTQISQSLDHIAAERARAVTTLGLTLAQLGALVAVVVALLASVAVTAQRGELGLARLRGEPARSLRRQVLGRWAAAMAIGWLLGWIPGVVLLAFTARALPLDHGLPIAPALLVVPLVALVLMTAGILPAAQAVLGQPVIELLRSSPSASREAGRRQLLVDAVVLVLALSGLLVAVQSGTDSVLAVLVPSLLAVAVGVLLARVMIGAAGLARRRWTARGRRAGGLLTAILLLRLRGLRLMIATICLAAAFVVFVVQVQVIGDEARRHEAEVRAGAVVVLRVDGDPAAVVRTLDRLDPRHAEADATMTAVVVTRRSDATATRGMFVEPPAFAGIAYGARLATDQQGWAAIEAPAPAPVEFAADAVTMTIGAHDRLGRTTEGYGLPRTGTKADIAIVYVSSEGSRHSVSLGDVPLGTDGPRRLQRPVDCADGCDLLQITIAPNGPMRGALPVTGLVAERSGGDRPVDLRTPDEWAPVPAAVAGATVEVAQGGRGLVLTVSSGGGPVAVQHASVPVVFPVLAAADVDLEADPVVAGPDGSPLMVQTVRTAEDAIPRELSGVVVGDLASVLRSGPGRVVPQAAVQVWLSAAAAPRLPEVVEALDADRLPVIETNTLEPLLDAQRTTASALTAVITPALAALALALAGLGIALTVAGQRSALARDLAALHLAGLDQPRLGRALIRGYLWPALVAVALGTAAGAVGCVLVIGGLPLLGDPSPAIHIDLSLRTVPLVACLVGAAVVVAVVALLGVYGVLRDSRIDRLRTLR